MVSCYCKCRFCDAELYPLGKCYVCKRCKTVALVNKMDNNTRFSNIERTIISIRKYLESNSTRLYDIEQRYMNHQELTQEESTIREYCIQFRDCQGWFSIFIKNGVNTTDSLFRQKLYQLLTLSLSFEEVFGSSCVKLTV